MKKKIFLLLRMLIVFILLDLSVNFSFAYAEKRNNPFGGVEFKVHKRQDKHIKIAALICALVENNANPSEIKIALFDQFPKPIDKSDEFLIVDSMFRMCPSIDLRTILNMNTSSNESNWFGFILEISQK